MHKRLLAILVCPKCKNNLEYVASANEVLCIKDLLAFPVRNGVPVLLESDARCMKNNIDPIVNSSAPVHELNSQ